MREAILFYQMQRRSYSKATRMRGGQYSVLEKRDSKVDVKDPLSFEGDIGVGDLQRCLFCCQALSVKLLHSSHPVRKRDCQLPAERQDRFS